MRNIPIPPHFKTHGQIHLADRSTDGFVELTLRKFTLSNAYIFLLQEILTKTTSINNKFKMSWRPYGKTYPRREHDRKKSQKTVFHLKPV